MLVFPPGSGNGRCHGNRTGCVSQDSRQSTRAGICYSMSRSYPGSQHGGDLPPDSQLSVFYLCGDFKRCLLKLPVIARRLLWVFSSLFCFVFLFEHGSARTLTLMVPAAAIGGTLQYGYNLAIMNAPTTYIQNFINETFVDRWGLQLEVYEVTLIWTFIVSVFSLGGFAGALLAGPMSIRFGRKKALLLNNIFLMSSALLAVTSRTARSFEMIIISRALVGINAGISMNVQPMYFGESAPKHLRGAVSLSSAVFTAFGVVLGQVVGLRELLGSESCWEYLLASNAIPGFIQLLTLPWFPESPRYLLIDRGDKEACLNALRRLRGCDVQKGELDEILQEQAEAKGERAKRPWELFTDRSVRWQLISVMVISSAMQLCGNDSIYFYASYVFKEAGISANAIQYVTVGTGTCEFTACILCNLLIERRGRKILLMGGYILMAGWAVVFTVALSFEEKVSWMPYLSMACIFTYILSFGMGPAGVTGVLPTEIFNQTARPAAYMIAGSLMWLNLFIIGMVFPFLVNSLGQYCFVPFGAVCLSTAIFIGLVLPETKGKTLPVISSEFHRLNFRGQEKAPPQAQPAQYQLGHVIHSTAL
ncbi:solute carrier family 2, facilitated glucose transporter member 11-like [Chanos chanos]|uniref:Solute carrier family 2, facilitated glucose transporter member 11-like n=1 Tax=Chanos chanos TaxID=29144 RepID=A0A6J2VRC4_CHACN|nr:solute carrier family 2, facilitated glucose transporter member 11-like [Chanos chanos]